LGNAVSSLKLVSRSLRAQLFAWVTATLVLATAVNLYLSFVSATSTSELITDRTLLASATSIAEAAHVDSNGMLLVDIPPAALEMFDTGHRDQVFYRVVTAWGSLAAGYPDLPKQGKLNTGENGIYRDLPVRALTLTHPIVGLSRDGAISVTVAVTQNSTRALRRSLWQSDIAKQLLLVALAGLVTIFGLQRGLAPVLNLRDAILNRSPDSLDPLPPDMVQSELRPLVYALNDQMAKVQSLVAAQKRFVSNAAHQLRTPLALLSTQASVALRERDAEKRDSTLQALNRSIRHVARLAGQLLTLSRAEPVNSRSRQDRVDLVAAAREALANHMGEALARGLDLGLEADVAVWVRGDAPMIREMVVNLIDNAVRYTPDNGIVTAAVREEQGKAVFTVADSGPGIPVEERARVFERFYRVAPAQGEGSGLGLSIVQEVVEGAGGKVLLGEAEEGGLLVTVELPLAPAAISQ
jgi:two-component system sensor histidine kinase TctE